MKTPKVGDTILVNTSVMYNGCYFHPALVNCVHSDVLVNATVFPDCSDPESATSIQHASDLSEEVDAKIAYCWIWPDELEEYQNEG